MKKYSQPRIPIPEPIKRLVRQKSGFGCCKCGLPIFQYHHIVPRSMEEKDIMPLCPTCHVKATEGAMTKSEQIHFKDNPVNLKRGYVSGFLKINQITPMVKLGTNIFIKTGVIFGVDDEDLLSLFIENGTLLLSVKLFDEKNNLLLYIERNEWITGEPQPWDIKSSFQFLSIRSKGKKILFKVNTKSEPLDIVGDLWYGGQNFYVDSEAMTLNGGELQDIIFTNSTFRNASLNFDTKMHALRVKQLS